MIVKFSNKGKFLLQIGGQERQQGQRRHEDRASVGGRLRLGRRPTRLFVADGYGNRRVIVFDADTGAFKRHVGRVR